MRSLRDETVFVCRVSDFYQLAVGSRVRKGSPDRLDFVVRSSVSKLAFLFRFDSVSGFVALMEQKYFFFRITSR